MTGGIILIKKIIEMITIDVGDDKCPSLDDELPYITI